jgi:hypothetical protein
MIEVDSSCGSRITAAQAQAACARAQLCFGIPYRATVQVKCPLIKVQCVDNLYGEDGRPACGKSDAYSNLISLELKSPPGMCPDLECVLIHELAHQGGAGGKDAYACQIKCCKNDSTFGQWGPDKQNEGAPYGGVCGCS